MKYLLLVIFRKPTNKPHVELRQEKSPLESADGASQRNTTETPRDPTATHMPKRAKLKALFASKPPSKCASSNIFIISSSPNTKKVQHFSHLSSNDFDGTSRKIKIYEDLQLAQTPCPQLAEPPHRPPSRSGVLCPQDRLAPYSARAWGG